MRSPSNTNHDVIIIGARSAGAAAAMLLARRGVDVLCIDRSAEGSDTLSTHALVRPGVEMLRSWGLMEALTTAGTPEIERVGYTYGSGIDAQHIDFNMDADSRLAAPRRTVIDPILIEAARAAGARFQFQTNLKALVTLDKRVTGVTLSGPRGDETHSARVVIGADGAGSLVARLVGAQYTFTGSHASASVFAYFGGWDDPAYDTYLTTDATVGAIATNERTACVFLCVSQHRFNLEIRPNIATGFWSVLDRETPRLASQLHDHPQVSRFRSFPGRLGFTRTAGGPGWLLIGDAGSFADPVTSHGMTSAFRDASAASRLIEELLGGRRESECWADFSSQRDAVAHPLISAADQIVAYTNPMDQLQQAHKTFSRLFREETLAIEAVPPSLAMAS